MNHPIAARRAEVLARIDAACRMAGRPPDSVALLAVSKTHPADSIEQLYACGQRMFGESYVQEAILKMDRLAHLPIEWHFIGPIQSNKSRLIAERFHWVHGIDRIRIAQRLGEQRPAGLPPMNVCIQVNISGEQSKSGASPAEVPNLAEMIGSLPALRLRGLMAIPEPSEDVGEQRAAFRKLREIFESLGKFDLDTLSMGMSNDLEAAIAEGSTLVRVGTALLGSRDNARSVGAPGLG